MDRLPFAKPERVKLTGVAYKKLQLAVFEADGWLCRACHKVKPLQAHHLQARSKGRIDTLENLVSLCASCHQRVTEHFIDVEWQEVHLRTLKITQS